MRKRVLTAAGLIPLVVGMLCANSPWPVIAGMFLVFWLGFLEINTMVGAPMRPPILGTALAIGAIWTELSPKGSPYEHWALLGGALSTILGALSLVTFSLRRELNWGLMATLRADLAGLWFVGPLFTVFACHQFFATEGMFNPAPPVLLAFIPIWVGDTTAIFVGRAFGKHPLWPEISPNKTWEGAFGNLIACLIAGAVTGIGVGVGLGLGLACGLIAGTLGQGGDLFESWVKRTAGVKDSGSILPGHGGFLDRMDSVLFAAPAICLLLILSSQIK